MAWGGFPPAIFWSLMVGGRDARPTGKIFAIKDPCENHVEQPPSAVLSRRGRLLYNISIY